MTFHQRKLLVLGAWVSAVMITGIIVAIDKPELWLLVACLALVPAGIVEWLWEAPEKTLSELIAISRSKS